ncbi:hypothetical protein PHYBLDRAFT_73293 [Phycomyces blakesleeanus NRRL 1555(-)]|uniref:Uncharacterized protein n=1 Tax=Phycomyces blakesleeanus (strain ATCC 8743b / DSM 1359 / FGSC 10004 / NBRC 33097 / NRRL 1555) TaxID=763407 RepID=A0A162ZLE0_PHYB8|nr:hypothetical protein PHYBLDRAFT_73293 [Phycomyces blakesleeanus NRRL 1555(-)]OAD67601.1 hypothetical protein PHYBLDRAFT_73293 [Phycomyces blakesleeanus NRRL 1555(-)]|eukprot:XP_018285641.1 hypothetical protein PHYBLDRAFT_73293 [Phycomyces blakesleeanus NRRL 1555(-)]
MIESQKLVTHPKGFPTPTAQILFSLKVDFKTFYNVLVRSFCQTADKFVCNEFTTCTNSFRLKCKCNIIFTASAMQALINMVQHKISEVQSASLSVFSVDSACDNSFLMKDIADFADNTAFIIDALRVVY